jgi:hypothetical protein
MSYDNLSSVSQNVLKFYQQLKGEERRIPFIFDDFHFCCFRVIGLDVTKNRIFTLCRMITWVLFLRMFWNFISSLQVKRGGSLSFLVGTISNVLVMEIGWTVIIRHRVKILFFVTSSPITLKRYIFTVILVLYLFLQIFGKWQWGDLFYSNTTR